MKNALYTTALILLYTFIKDGFSLETFLWYVLSVIIITPVMYALDRFVLKPFIKKFFNFEEVE